MKTRIKPMCGFLIMVTVLGFVTIAHAGDKMEICHVPPDDPDNYHTINVSDKALAGHVRHGDKFMEPCDADCDTICGDENMCTQDYDPTVGCAIGGCYPEPIPLPPGSCDDGNLCTVDSCDALEGCKNVDVICDVNASCNPDTGECESSSKIIFITSETYTGNLGGLAGADVECNSLAEAAELSGTYKAWLSTPTVSAADRLTHSEVPYVLPDGTRVADDWIDFTDGALAHAIDMTDTGATISLPTLHGQTPCLTGHRTDVKACPKRVLNGPLTKEKLHKTTPSRASPVHQRIGGNPSGQH